MVPHQQEFLLHTTVKCHLVLRKINTNHMWECDAATRVTTRLWVDSDSSSGHAPEHPKVLLQLLRAAGSSLTHPFLPLTDPWPPEEFPGHKAEHCDRILALPSNFCEHHIQFCINSKKVNK